MFENAQDSLRTGRGSNGLYLVLLAWLVLFAPLASRGQSGAGSIQGTVQDSTGAAIPNAAVHVVNIATGVAYDTKANASGFYTAPSLFAGTYSLSFMAAGMQKYETTLTLQVSQTAVLDPKLVPGEVTSTVVVTGNTAQLADYENPTISSTLDNQRINQLPENGRNILTLLQESTPGLEAGGTRVNGLEVAGVEYVQDGAPLSNRNGGGPTLQPDPDSIQEVRLETTNSNAQFAEPATAVVTTKSGTNQFHGTFFETARNNAIGVAKLRSDPANLVAPKLVRNEFGASFGGPIKIPKLYNGKDRSFFFVAFERYSLRQLINYQDTVPTVAERNGDFSSLLSTTVGNGIPQVLYDPSTSGTAANGYARTAFTNNMIPTSRISPLAQALYAITPLPTSAVDPRAGSNYIAPGITDQTTPTVTSRLDQTIDQNNRVFLRYTQTLRSLLNLRTPTTAQLPNTLSSPLLGAESTNFQSAPIKVYSAGFGYTHVFSPTLVSQLTIGQQWENDNVEGGGNTQTNYNQLLGLPDNFGEVGFPQIGSSNLFTYYQGSQYNYDGSQIIFNLDEDLTKTLLKHQLFFGGRFRHEHLGVLPDRSPDTVAFNGQATGLNNPASGANYTALANTGNANADFYLGAASSYSVQLNSPYLHYHDAEYDAYFQDDWHVTDKLTLNLGLRYEAHPAIQEQNNLVFGFDFTHDALVTGEPVAQMIATGATTQALITNLENLGVVFESPQQAGLPPHLVNGANLIFSPRLGFAYSPFKTGAGTVFRAGFGQYAYPIPTRNFYSIQKSDSPISEAYSQSYTAANQSPDGLPNYLLRAPQAVIAGKNSSGVVNTGTTTSVLPGGPTETVFNPHYPPNLVQELSATVEQPLKGNQVLRVSYGYEHGSNLDQLNYHNQAIPNYVYEATTGMIPPTGTYASVALNPYDNHTYSTITSDDRNGYSNNNFAQVNFQRLYKKGLAYQGFYTYSRAFRVGGNTFRDSAIYPVQDYLPGVLAATDPQSVNRQVNYQIDSAIPKHHIGLNFIYDLPIGRGKKYFGSVNRFVDELIGGYQIAGDATITSQFFQVSGNNFGPTAPIKLYKGGKTITDCSFNPCRQAHLWFNGYISPNLTNPYCGAAPTITGLPADYVPYQQPIQNNPGTVTCSGTTATFSNKNYLTNNVPLTLANGSTVTIGYQPGPSANNYSGSNPFSHTYLPGPWIHTADASIFKVFPITEKVNFRLNADFFNVFNIQGLINPNTTSGEQFFTPGQTSSQNSARQVQLTARLTF